MQRLQKVIAQAGITSRRKAELLILEGRVTVNGRLVTELGTKVQPEQDKIKVNGKLLFTEIEPICVAFYKPRGVLSALSDRDGKENLGNYLRQIRERVVPIGQMDFNSEGLLLLSNMGNLVEKIIKNPDLLKTYLVKVKGFLTNTELNNLKRGFITKKEAVVFKSVSIEKKLKNKTWLKLEVIRGANQDLREILNHKRIMVDRIIRSAIGNIELGNLKPGEFRFLRKETFAKLALKNSS